MLRKSGERAKVAEKKKKDKVKINCGADKEDNGGNDLA